MAIGLATAIRSARATEIMNAIDAGAAGDTLGIIRMYTTPQPATGASVGAATLLAELKFSANPCGAVNNGVLTFVTITADASADNDGTAVWARIVDSDGTFVLDCTVGEAGSGADIIINNADIVAGGEVSIDDFASITEGNA